MNPSRPAWHVASAVWQTSNNDILGKARKKVFFLSSCTYISGIYDAQRNESHKNNRTGQALLLLPGRLRGYSFTGYV